jgi:hypothetical protein
MPAYDPERFTPPAPLAWVDLRSRATGIVWSSVPMLIDSGADVTLIPQAALEHLGIAAVPDKGYELIGFDGAASIARIVHVESVFCRRTFRGQFLLADQQWGIIGRNILNAASLLLDGPNMTWDEHRASGRSAGT